MRLYLLNRIVKILLFALIFLSFNKFNSTDLFAACSNPCSSTNDCNTCSGSSYDWDCLSGECCSCLNGWAPDYSYVGPINCAGRVYNAAGCYPSSPTNAPTSTPGILPSPTTVPVTGNWLCMYPGSTGSKCEMLIGLNCPNPDIIGAACFTTQERCETGCTLMSPPPFISKTPIEMLCTIVPGRYGINTAVGCFPTDSTNGMLVFILRWALGVAGGIAFLLIVFSAFLIMTSGGNAEKVKSGRELLTAALTGLVVLIFSVFILDLVGLRILQIPGL